MMYEAYIVITEKLNGSRGMHEIQDLEILDSPPQFSNRVEESEDAFPNLRIRVFVGNINGGDSVELHWNDQVGSWM